MRVAGIVEIVGRSIETIAFRPRKFTPRERNQPVQIHLFEPVDHDIAKRIRELKLDELRPIEEPRLLEELQEELRPCV
jgi:hypothetical protein